MTLDEGAAARLERITEARRQAPDAAGLHRDPAFSGVTVAWLGSVFGMDERTVKAKLRFCPVKRSQRRGRTMVTNYYDIKEAARYLVVPAVTTQDVLRELKHGQLPPALQQSVWDALLKRQTWEERAGQLWRTEKVREVLGSTFQSIKFTTQLWAETVERSTELTADQRELIVGLSDQLLADVYAALVERAGESSTGPQLAEMEDHVGETEPVHAAVHEVESPEDDEEYEIARLV